MNGQLSKAYIDFGSSCNTISASEVKRLQLPIDESRRCVMKGYGDGRVASLGTTGFDLQIDEVKSAVEANVVPDGVQDVPLLVGHPFTEQSGLRVTKDARVLQFENMPLLPVEQEIKKVRLRANQPLIIPQNYMGHIPVRSLESYEGDVMVEASIRLKEGSEYSIPGTVITLGKDRTAVLPIINLATNDIEITSKELIARAWPCVREEASEKDQSVLRVLNHDLPKLKQSDIETGQLNENNKQQLLDLLNRYRDCFAENNSELGIAKSAELEIHLENNRPFTFRPYRMSASEQEIVKTMVEELVKDGIIRESNSSYSSPILLVKKKNGESRLCIDYRKLNSQSIKDRYPLPRIDDQLDRLHGSCCFTSLDLRAGYYQIPVSEKSKHLTAFVTNAGQYEFNRMPFGLANAPSVFQRLINKVLGPVKNIAAVYLDDVLIHTPTIEEGLEKLESVLKLLREEGLTLNVKKCSFLKSSVTYLGFEISQGRVQPGNDKTKAIDEFSVPQNVHQIRQFIGLTGYFRHFVKDYARLAKPLTTLLKKSASWKWGADEEQAFRELQAALSKRPILALFNPTAYTEVHTDASKYGVAGILLQKQDDQKLHPTFYYSRQTTTGEQKYHSYELETLAVVESLKKFRVYLIGMKFTVVTDCSALKATSSKKEILPRIARWWLQLQEFNFDVQYRPGERMKHVDALSRNPSTTEQPPEETLFRITQDDWVLSGQITDEKIKAIHDILSKPPEDDIHEKFIKIMPFVMDVFTVSQRKVCNG